MEEIGVPGRVLLLRPDLEGLIVDGASDLAMTPARVPHPHLRVPDERARLRAPGRAPRGRRAGADRRRRARRRRGAQHLLHPGERRQQALRPSRAAQGAARPPARACRSPWGAAWPRRTGTLVRTARRPRRRGVRHPQPGPCPGAAAPGRRRRARSSRSSTRPTPRARRTCPSALSAARELPYAAWVTIQMGCDNSCAFCIVPQVRGPEVSRPFDDIVAEVAGPGGPGRHRGDAARPERQLLRTRPDPPPAAVRRPAAGGGRGRRHPAGPLHEPAPEGPAARDDRGHGRDAGGVRAPPPAPAVGQRPGAQRHAPRLHAPSATWSAWPRPAPPIADLAVTTDIIVGFPGETDDDFERTLEVAAEAEYDSAYTFIFSPRPGTRAAAMTDAVRPRRGGGRALRAAAGGGGALRAAPATEARVGRVEEVIVEGPSAARPGGAHAGGPARTSWCTSPRRRGGPRRRAPTPRSASPTPPPTTCAASWCAVTAGPPARIRIPVSAAVAAELAAPALARPGCRRGPATTWPWSGPRRRGSRPWPSPWPGGDRDVELVSVDSMCVYRGMDIGTAKPTRGRAGRGAATTSLDLVDPDEEFTV